MLEAEWKAFEAAVMPPEAGAIQRRECRRAFYGGAASLFGLVMRRLSPDAEPTAEDLALMDGLFAELKQYAVDLEAGRA